MQVCQVLHLELDQAGTILNCLQNFSLLRVLEAIYHVLGKHDDRLLRHLNLIGDAVTSFQKILRLRFFLAVFDKLREILHIDQEASLVIKQDIQNFDLDDLLFSLVYFVRICESDLELFGIDTTFLVVNAMLGAIL